MICSLTWWRIIAARVCLHGKASFFARLETQYLKRLYENYASSQFSLSRLHLVLVEVNTFKLLNPNGCMKVPWKGHSCYIPNTRGPTKLNAGRRIFALYSKISIICLVLTKKKWLEFSQPGARCPVRCGKWQMRKHLAGGNIFKAVT